MGSTPRDKPALSISWGGVASRTPCRARADSLEEGGEVGRSYAAVGKRQQYGSMLFTIKRKLGNLIEKRRKEVSSCGYVVGHVEGRENYGQRWFISCIPA